jgi:hypothetical protein
MAEPWPAATSRDDLLARVASQGRRRVVVRRFVAAAAAAVVVTSAAVGFGVGRSGGLDLVGEPAGVSGNVVADGVAPFSPCPGDDPIGELHRQDRVYLTGRNEDGSWFELRSPAAPGDRVWVQAAVVGPDGDTAELPVLDCARDGDQLALPAATTAPPTTVVGETTTTAPGATTTTTRPASTTTAPATVPPTSSTSPVDSQAPVVTNLKRSTAFVYENDPYCPEPRTVVLSAAISDASTITARVEWRYQSPGKTYTTGQAVMSPTGPGGRYEATIGPFGVNTALASNSTITWRVVASDALGNGPTTVDASSNQTVTLRAGSSCVG